MTSHHGRLYALAASILLFFVAWAVVAAHPWAAPEAAARDPRLVALAQREQRLRNEAGLVQRVVVHRSQPPDARRRNRPSSRRCSRPRPQRHPRAAASAS